MKAIEIVVARQLSIDSHQNWQMVVCNIMLKLFFKLKDKIFQRSRPTLCLETGSLHQAPCMHPCPFQFIRKGTIFSLFQTFVHLSLLLKGSRLSMLFHLLRMLLMEFLLHLFDKRCIQNIIIYLSVFSQSYT